MNFIGFTIGMMLAAIPFSLALALIVDRRKTPYIVRTMVYNKKQNRLETIKRKIHFY